MKIVKTLINEFDILITSALGLVTALAWNEAFKNYFQNHKTLRLVEGIKRFFHTQK